MDQQDWLAQQFEQHRPHLRAVAYRMLGSLSEADDAVQDAWLRLSRVDADEIENLGGWLTTVVARLSLNMLRQGRDGTAVCAQHHIGVQQGDESVEVAVARGGEECIDDLPLSAHIRVGRRCAPHATTGTAGQLARGFG